MVCGLEASVEGLLTSIGGYHMDKPWYLASGEPMEGDLWKMIGS